MVRSRKLVLAMPALLLSLAGIACDNNTTNTIAPVSAQVSLLDQCDPATFNAALGAGTCTGTGTVTLSQFNAELNATHAVATWTIVPATLTVRVGQTITATNMGGEGHTFTEVANFGGGIVPALNTASGNPVEAPECAALAASDHIAPGAKKVTDEATTVGTENYQCCIHPWMRAKVTVIN